MPNDPGNRMPNAADARVDRTKIVDYLLSLNHPDGRSKAIFFGSIGYDRRRWGQLAAALKRHGADNEVTAVRTTDHGALYTVDGTILGPTHRPRNVRTVWLIAKGTVRPRLVTAYPLRGNSA